MTKKERRRLAVKRLATERSVKLYKDAGINPQQLAGHSSGKMTKNYDSGHDEIRWIETETI